MIDKKLGVFMISIGSRVTLSKNKQQPGGPIVFAGTEGIVKNIFSGEWIYVDFEKAQIACQKKDVKEIRK